MKASELVKALERFIHAHGDREAFLFGDFGFEEVYGIEFNKDDKTFYICDEKLYETFQEGKKLHGKAKPV